MAYAFSKDAAFFDVFRLKALLAVLYYLKIICFFKFSSARPYSSGNVYDCFAEEF